MHGSRRAAARRSTRRRGWAAALAIASSSSVVAGCSEDGPGRWDLVSVDGRDLRLSVLTGSSSCNRVDGVDVDEAADAVAIRVHVDADRNGDCTADLATEEVTVTLDEPLGDRDLLGCRPDDPVVGADLTYGEHRCAEVATGPDDGASRPAAPPGRG